MAPRSRMVVKNITIINANPRCDAIAVFLRRFLMVMLTRAEPLVPRARRSCACRSPLPRIQGWRCQSLGCETFRAGCPFADNIDLFAVTEERALGGAVRHGAITKEFHVGRQARRGRLDRNLWHGIGHTVGYFRTRGR